MEAYVARQPIFDNAKNLYAYELLFRDGLTNFIPDVDGDEATSKVLSSSFFTIGMDKVTGGKRAFINFTQRLIEERLPLLFPADTTVVELLEDVIPTSQVIESCAHISAQGYLLALDDFVYAPEFEPLLKLADIVKIDFRLTPLDQIEPLVTNLLANGIRLLAEKVETVEEFSQAREMGFDYFQGYFFCKPEILQGKEISNTQMGSLQLMAEVNKEDFEFDKIVSVLERDVSVSYKLLRYINSAVLKTKSEIKTIKHATRYLGRDELRRFVSLIIMTNIASDKPVELVRNSCVKAKFCELLGVASNHFASSELFTLGLFSNIDAILDQPIADIMARLPLSENIKRAVSGERNELSDYLDLALNYERGEWQAVLAMAATLGLDQEMIPAFYLEACTWANELTA